MHTNRMRTARLLTVSDGGLPHADPTPRCAPLDANPRRGRTSRRCRPLPSHVTCDACWEDTHLLTEGYYLAPNFVCGQ